jgi:hypothetical protein
MVCSLGCGFVFELFYLPIEIGKLTLQHTFYVLEYMTRSLILGMDFIEEQGANILTEQESASTTKGYD